MVNEIEFSLTEFNEDEQTNGIDQGNYISRIITKCSRPLSTKEMVSLGEKSGVLPLLKKFISKKNPSITEGTNWTAMLSQYLNSKSRLLNIIEVGSGGTPMWYLDSLPKDFLEKMNIYDFVRACITRANKVISIKEMIRIGEHLNILEEMKVREGITEDDDLRSVIYESLKRKSCPVDIKSRKVGGTVYYGLDSISQQNNGIEEDKNFQEETSEEDFDNGESNNEDSDNKETDTSDVNETEVDATNDTELNVTNGKDLFQPLHFNADKPMSEKEIDWYRQGYFFAMGQEAYNKSIRVNNR